MNAQTPSAKSLGPGTFTLARDFDVFQVVLIFSKSSGINLALDVLIGNNRSGSQFLGKFHRFFIEGIIGHNAVDNARSLASCALTGRPVAQMSMARFGPSCLTRR